METSQIEELKRKAEQAATELEEAIKSQRKEALKEVKRLIKDFKIKEREVRNSFEAPQRRRKPKA
ncbi:hypothetical protein GN241_08700 [Rhodobacteraceae bacterium IMCC1335]